MATRPARRFARRRSPYRLLAPALLATVLIARFWFWPPNTPWGWRTLEEGPYRVLQVLDGTLALEPIGNTTSDASVRLVRMLGVRLQDGQQAEEVLQQLASGQRVTVRLDRRRIDHEGNLLAYIFVDDLLLNAEMVRLGLAREATHPADSGPMIRRIKADQEEARSLRRGIWKMLKDPQDESLD